MDVQRKGEALGGWHELGPYARFVAARIDPGRADQCDIARQCRFDEIFRAVDAVRGFEGAASSDSLAVLFRPHQAACNHAPASLRLQVREYRKVHILKQRGGNQAIDVDLPPAEDIPQQPQLWELPVYPSGGQLSPAMGV